MRLSLISLSVFTAFSLVEGGRHRCARSSALSSAAAASLSSSTSTATPSSSTPLSSIETPLSSIETPSASSVTPAVESSTINSAASSSTPISDQSSTPISTDASTIPSSATVSTPAPASDSTSATPISSAPSSTPSSSSSTSAPVPTGWRVQSSGAGSALAGSFLYTLRSYPGSVGLAYEGTDANPLVNLYIEPSTGHLFLDLDGVKNRYSFVTTYDDWTDIGEYFFSVNPGTILLWDHNISDNINYYNNHYTALVCTRTGSTFGCTANTPSGVYNTFVYNPTNWAVNFGTVVPQGSQAINFVALDVY